MLRAMDSAVSGLRAHQNKLDVIGNLNSASLCKDFAVCFVLQGEFLDCLVQIHCCLRVQSNNGGNGVHASHPALTITHYIIEK